MKPHRDVVSCETMVWFGDINRVILTKNNKLVSKEIFDIICKECWKDCYKRELLLTMINNDGILKRVERKHSWMWKSERVERHELYNRQERVLQDTWYKDTKK